MKRVIVYVEGPSDRSAMEALLVDLLARLRDAGVTVNFFPTGGKKKLLDQVPVKAVNTLRNDPYSVVIALPDLYPPNVAFDHTTPDEMVQELQQAFESTLARKRLEDAQLCKRFHVYCFKHDLEALILAAEDQLASRLGASSVERTWVTPVEDQDHGVPPKRVVEQLFRAHGQRYKDTADAPVILKAARYPEIVAACPQCFGPFVDYLESLG